MENQREATPTEILVDQQQRLRYDRPVRFRHFVREIYAPRSKNGVRHKQYSSSRLRVVDGVPYVQHHGELVPMTATYVELDNGRGIIFDFRIKSEYLP